MMHPPGLPPDGDGDGDGTAEGVYRPTPGRGSSRVVKALGSWDVPDHPCHVPPRWVLPTLLCTAAPASYRRARHGDCRLDIHARRVARPPAGADAARSAPAGPQR